MLSITVWLFPEIGPCANPRHSYTGYIPCVQCFGSVPILLQTYAPGLYSRFLTGYLLLVGQYWILLHLSSHLIRFRFSILCFPFPKGPKSFTIVLLGKLLIARYG